MARKKEDTELPITTYSLPQNLVIFSISVLGIILFGYFLGNIDEVWSHIPSGRPSLIGIPLPLY